nr:hypothetical protein [Tanacetum cinerariifolium]
GRIIADIDEDVEINLEEAQAKTYRMDLEHPKKVLSMQDVDDEDPTKVEEVLEVVTVAKLITEVVTTAGATTTTEATKVRVPMKRMGVVIQDPEETTSTVVVHSEIEQDEAFARQLEAELNADINWNVVIDQVKISERLNDVVIKYQDLKRKPLTEAQARKNMIIYLKNMVGYKMNYFKGMTYNEIRPLFEKYYYYNQAFLEEVNEGVIVQEKEVKVEGHKKKKLLLWHQKFLLLITRFTFKGMTYSEIRPLFEKYYYYNQAFLEEVNEGVTVQEKEVKVEGHKKKNFNREDQESLWKLVKESFEKTEPKNYIDDYLLKTLKIMFEQPNVEASVWRDQKGRYGLAKRYPLTHFTLEQMLNNVRLEVEEESEMSLELLRGGLLGIMDFNILLLLFILSAAAWNYCWHS